MGCIFILVPAFIIFSFFWELIAKIVRKVKKNKNPESENEEINDNTNNENENNNDENQ